MSRKSIWAWIILIIGLLYFFIPLISVFIFSLKAIKGTYSFEAFRVAFEDPRFYKSFGAREVPYYMVNINKLPWPIKAGVRLIKGF